MYQGLGSQKRGKFEKKSKEKKEFMNLYLHSNDESIIISLFASIAQLVEHFTRNEGVVGSNPILSFF